MVEGVRRALYATCVKILLDYDQILRTTQTFLEQNCHCHNDVREFIENMHWTRLAKRIYADLHDVPHILPPDEWSKWIEAIKKVRIDTSKSWMKRIRRRGCRRVELWI